MLLGPLRAMRLPRLHPVRQPPPRRRQRRQGRQRRLRPEASGSPAQMLDLSDRRSPAGMRFDCIDDQLPEGSAMSVSRKIDGNAPQLG